MDERIRLVALVRELYGNDCPLTTADKSILRSLIKMAEKPHRPDLHDYERGFRLGYHSGYEAAVKNFKQVADIVLNNMVEPVVNEAAGNAPSLSSTCI